MAEWWYREYGFHIDQLTTVVKLTAVSTTTTTPTTKTWRNVTRVGTLTREWSRFR